LWQQHWPRYRFFPLLAHSADNARFAVSTLRLANTSSVKTNNSAGNEADALLPDAAEVDVFEQEVQVFDTATGDPVASVPVSPAIIGQNFAFSPDGRRLAVLQDSSLEWFELLPSSEKEQSSFAALKADVPDLGALGLAPDSSPSADSTSANSSIAGTSASASGASTPTRPESNSPARTDAAAPAFPAPAPEAQAPAEPIATIRVSTKAVVVDVVVTDSKGHPIKGLHEQDFQLAEDGKGQDVRAFHEVRDPDDPTAAAAEPVAAPPAVPAKSSPNVFQTSRRQPNPGSVTMILFDMLNTPSQDQAYARQQLVKFLQTKPKSMQFAICTMSVGSRLRLVQGFTPDETVLVAAAKGRKIMPKDVRWQTSAQGIDNTVSTVSDLAAGGATSGFQGLLSALQETQVQEQVADTNERAGITMDSMTLLARYLAGIPGRKNIVWLSGSFPFSITATTNSGNPAVDNPNYGSKIKRVTNLLAEAQIAVYPVDVRGLMINGVGADSAGGMGGPSAAGPQDFSSASVISPSAPLPADMQALGQQASERDTLIEFAKATGGKAFYNSNGIREAIATAAEQGANYYSLSYTPANKVYDGKFRRIKVQLAEKGYTLHYRQGYYADDARSIARDTELSRRARAVAMQHGSPPSRQLQFSATVAPAGPKKKMERAKLGDVPVVSPKAPPLPEQVEAQHYFIDYTLDGSELRFIPQPNSTFRNSLTLMVASFDRDGRMISATSSVGVNDLQPAAYEKVIAGEFGVQQEVDIPVDAASLRVGIQDQMSNHIGTVDIPLPVPPMPGLARHFKSALPEIEPD
jgi:VWFA-related protein